MCASIIFERYKGRLLVLYGDVFNWANFIEKLLNNCNNTFNLIGFEATDPRGYGRIVTNKNKIIEIAEKKTQIRNQKIKFCNSGIFVVHQNLFLVWLRKLLLIKIKGVFANWSFRFSF